MNIPVILDLKQMNDTTLSWCQGQLFVSALEEGHVFCVTCKAVSLRPTHTDCHINTAWKAEIVKRSFIVRLH